MRFGESQTLKSHLSTGRWSVLGITHLLHSVLVLSPSSALHPAVTASNWSGWTTSIGLNNTNVLSYSFEVQYGVHWAQIKIGQGRFPCSFLVWRSSTFLGSRSFSSIFKASNGVSSSHILSLCPLLPPNTQFKDPCDYSTTHTIQDNLLF